MVRESTNTKKASRSRHKRFVLYKVHGGPGTETVTVRCFDVRTKFRSGPSIPYYEIDR